MREYRAVHSNDNQIIDFFIGNDLVATATRESSYNGKWVVRNRYSCVIGVDVYRNDLKEFFRAKMYDQLLNRSDLEK